jgi:pimeloyl-ACP methyl ester carboxylesterase
MSNTLVDSQQPQILPKLNGTNGTATNGESIEEPITEEIIEIGDRKIGYERYGHGPMNFLFICGGVGELLSHLINLLVILGCYKKDYPENVLRAFDPNFFTIVCIDPPGYGESRPPDRKQEINLNKKDAQFGIALMENLKLTPFAVLGWSEGGRTAIHLAHQAPKLCSHVVLLSTSTKVDFRGDMAFKGRIFFWFKRENNFLAE